jgi:hypothetical protein
MVGISRAADQELVLARRVRVRLTCTPNCMP